MEEASRWILEVHFGPQRSLPLTARELEVARLAAQGMTYRRIAEELFLSANTVKTHLERAYRKLGVKNRIELEHKLASLAPPPRD